MKSNILIAILLLIALSNNGCMSETTQNQQIVNNWVGKTIVLPDSISGYMYRRGKTILKGGSLIPPTDYKIVLYIGELGCTTCKLKLYEWNRRMIETRTWNDTRLSYIFIFHTKNENELISLIKRDRISHPIIIDNDDVINKRNKFPKKEELQCFLLNKDNKVILVGNPIQNPALWALYKKTIESGVQ